MQIQEHTAREIRNRTAARIGELYREAEDGRQRIEGNRAVFIIVEEDREDELCYRLCCVFLFLFFAYCLYHAYKKR